MNSQPGNIVAIAVAFLLVACGGSSGGSASQPLPPINHTPPPPVGTIGDGRLDQLAEWARAMQGVPAIAVVVVANSRIAEIAAVGKRSLTAVDSVTVDDRWHLGSLTKAFTATLAGVLVEQSVMSWDTAPLDIWPELDGSIHPEFRDITLKQLLSHTSGMRRVNEIPAEFAESAPGAVTARRRALAAQLLSEAPIGPQGRESYSNGGYIVAAAMFETLMSTSWETLLTEQVFNPLGMLESGFGAPGSTVAVDQPWGHWESGLSFEAVPPGPGADNPDTMGPAGTVHVTLRDYGQFMLSHLAGAGGIDGLLTSPTYEVLHTPLHNGSALGWGVTASQSWAQGPVLSHAGSNLRWYAVVRLAPALNAGVMIVVNAGGGRANAAVDSLGDLILERYLATQ